MAYATVGTQGSVHSWGSTNIYSKMLAAMISQSATYTQTEDDAEVTGLNSTAASEIPGLKTSSVEISSILTATPFIGNLGNIAFSGGTTYAVHPYAWEWNIESAAVHDITEMGSTVKFRSFRPDYVRVSGTIHCYADITTGLVNLPDPAATLTTLTLTYNTGATLAGGAVLKQLGAAVRRGDKNMVSYSFKGDNTTSAWTSAGGLFANDTSAAPFTVPTWSAGGAAAGALEIHTVEATKKIAIADSFWRRISIRCSVGELVTANLSVVGSGAVTMT